jgi:transcriptional regulator with XRE-family HTH domain
MNFAEKMIELRKQQNLSQQDLADRLGVSRQAISRWETGAVQPLADSVKSLAQVFQVSTDYLLNDDLDDPTPLHPPQPAPPQEEPTPTRKHRKWLLALAALAAAAVLILATALGTAYYLQWKERQPVSMYDLPRETAEESIRDRSVVTFSFDEW